MRIKELRELKGMQQKELALVLNIPSNTLSQYENGKREPGIDILKTIAEYFGVTTDYLIENTHQITCPVCYHSYDPLNPYDAKEHAALHDEFTSAQKKYGEILLYGNADQKRSESIHRLNNPTLSTDERISAFDDYLKYEFMLSIWRSHFDLSHENFDTFCKKEMGLSMTKEVLDNIGDDVYRKMVDKYGVADDSDYHKVIKLTPRDNRDIKKDLDSIMEKLTSKEYGPAAYDGEDLSEESAELFRDELEIALKRLKLINKEKYNPNKNKK